MSENNDNEKNIYQTSIETIKFIASVALTALGVGFVGITIFSGITLNSERGSIEELRIETNIAIQEQISRLESSILNIEKIPNVEAFSEIGKPLNGQVIQGTMFKGSNNNQVNFSIILKNTGNGRSDPLFVKIYTREPLKLGSNRGKSSDEPNYDYENVTDSTAKGQGEMHPSILPAGASTYYDMSAEYNGTMEKGTKYPILLKVYSGTQKPHVSNFELVFN